MSLTLSSAEMMHLVVASKAIFEPLLEPFPEALAEPAWASWLAHYDLLLLAALILKA